jgi:hypothetical protein
MIWVSAPSNSQPSLYVFWHNWPGYIYIKPQNLTFIYVGNYDQWKHKTWLLLTIFCLLLSMLARVTSSVCNSVCLNPDAVCYEYCETPEGNREKKWVDSCVTTKLGYSLINNVLANKIRVLRSVREWIVLRFK